MMQSSPKINLFMISVKHQLTLQEFLTLPEEDITYELVNGEAKPKISPKRFHSRLTIEQIF
jgi:Uma2 family endonuclease